MLHATLLLYAVASVLGKLAGYSWRHRMWEKP